MDDNQNNKELGLIDILQIMGQWAVALTQKVAGWFLYLLFFGLKHWKILGPAVLIIGIFTVVSYKSQSAQYEASMMVRSNAVKSTQMKPFIDAYGNLLHNSILSDSVVSLRTGLDRLQRSSIGSVSTYYCVDVNKDGIMDEVDIAGKLKLSDNTLDTLNLNVKIIFEDVTILDAVVASIGQYLDNVPYLTRMNESRLIQQNKRKNFLLNEINLLDTIQQRSYADTDAASSVIGRGGILVDNRRVMDVYEDKMTLLGWYEDVEKEINFFSEPITVIEDFVVRERAVNTLSSMLKKNLVYGFAIVYALLFFFLVIFKEKDKYLNK